MGPRRLARVCFLAIYARVSPSHNIEIRPHSPSLLPACVIFRCGVRTYVYLRRLIFARWRWDFFLRCECVFIRVYDATSPKIKNVTLRLFDLRLTSRVHIAKKMEWAPLLFCEIISREGRISAENGPMSFLSSSPFRSPAERALHWVISAQCSCKPAANS